MLVPSFTLARQSQITRRVIELWPAYHGTNAVIAQVVSATKTTGECMLVDGHESLKIADDVSFETAAPLACEGCTVWRGVLQTELQKGETLAIIGAGGGLGHLGCQVCKGDGTHGLGY